jgi:hypothetical protein
MDWDGIKEVGFPIAVAAFVLVRLNGKMDKLTDALHDLREVMVEVKSALDQRD